MNRDYGKIASNFGFPLVELTRKMDISPWYGFVVIETDTLVILNHVSDRYDLDGYCAFRRKDLKSIEKDFERRDVIERALVLKEQAPEVPNGVNASSMKALMESAQKIYDVLFIERELIHSNEAEVGIIRMTSEDTYVLRWPGTTAHWENDDRPFCYRDVTRLVFGSEYEQTLVAVARSREADR